MSEIFVRNSTLTDVDVKLRLIDLVAVPWDEEADVFWHDEMWRESFKRGAFDGIAGHAGRVPIDAEEREEQPVRVNREHVRGDTVGNVIRLDPQGDPGLLARVKVANTLRGDETLALAEENMISASIGYFTKLPSDVELNKRTKTRRVLRAFLDHLAMVESPAYAGARVLAVREDQSGLTVVETPLPETPVLDEMMNDDVLMWAASRATRD